MTRATAAARSLGFLAAAGAVLGLVACQRLGWYGTAEEAMRACRRWRDEGGTFRSRRYADAGQFLSGEHEGQTKEHARRHCIVRDETRQVLGYQVRVDPDAEPYDRRNHPEARLARRFRW
jgi:hypothetical protein